MATHKNPAGLDMDPEMTEVWKAYAKWWYTVLKAQEDFEAVLKPLEWDGDDLGDFVTNISSLMTFGPNPVLLHPPIHEEDVL